MRTLSFAKGGAHAWMRRLLLLALLAGCGLDENGLLGSSDGGVDAAFVDATVDAPADGNVAEASDDGAVDATVDAGVDSGDSGGDASFDSGPDAPYDAGPILTITGGTYSLLDRDAGLCSQSGSPASFQITNERDAAVDLVWVDQTCVEHGYGTIAPQGTKPQGTYVTHVWRIRNDADQSFLAGFVLSSPSTFTVTVH